MKYLERKKDPVEMARDVYFNFLFYSYLGLSPGPYICNMHIQLSCIPSFLFIRHARKYVSYMVSYWVSEENIS